MVLFKYKQDKGGNLVLYINQDFSNLGELKIDRSVSMTCCMTDLGVTANYFDRKSYILLNNAKITITTDDIKSEEIELTSYGRIFHTFGDRVPYVVGMTGYTQRLYLRKYYSEDKIEHIINGWKDFLVDGCLFFIWGEDLLHYIENNSKFTKRGVVFIEYDKRLDNSLYNFLSLDEIKQY